MTTQAARALLACMLLSAACAGQPKGNAAPNGSQATGAATTGQSAGTTGASPGTGASTQLDSGSSITSMNAGHTDASSGGSGPATDASVASLTDPDAAALVSLPACTGTLSEIFSKSVIMPPATGSGVFNAVSTPKWQALEASLRSLVKGDTQAALASAQTAEYELCRVDDSGSLVLVARPHTAGLGHAVVAWRPSALHSLIVEAPHAWHDVDTDIEALELFIGVKARALVLSGIYRCSSLNASPCDGYTTGCTGVPIRYTESDAAHNVEMFFQAAHVALSESFAKDDVISVHGFEDNGVSVSNTTKASPALDSLQVRLVKALTAALPGEMITSCQQYAGAPYQSRMCGDDNVQARHLNGAANACTTNPTTTTNRFVHMEQSHAVRGKRNLVLMALQTALQ